MTIKELKIQLALGSIPDNERQQLAMLDETPKSILTILSNDKDWTIRYWVVKNNNITIEILKRLSNDENLSVRQQVAKHPKTPINILTKLIKGDNFQISYDACKTRSYKM